MANLSGGGLPLFSRLNGASNSTQEQSEDKDLSTKSVVDSTPETASKETTEGLDASFDPQRDEIREKEPNTERRGSFHVNKAARDSREESTYAKRAVYFFDRLEEVLAQTIEESKMLTREIARSGDIAHRTVTEVSSLGAISSSLSSLREGLASGAIGDKAAAASATGRSVGAEATGRSDHYLKQLAESTQNDLKPAPVTFNDVDIRSTIAVARSDLGEISSHLQDIEARLVAQCSIDPFGNSESMKHLDMLRFVKSQVSEIDSHLRDVA